MDTILGAHDTRVLPFPFSYTISWIFTFRSSLLLSSYLTSVCPSVHRRETQSTSLYINCISRMQIYAGLPKARWCQRHTTGVVLRVSDQDKLTGPRLFLPLFWPRWMACQLSCNLGHKQMDSLRYGSTNPLRGAVKTIRTLVNDRREYLVGVILLLVVVLLWALSNFVTQARDNSFSPINHS